MTRRHAVALVFVLAILAGCGSSGATGTSQADETAADTPTTTTARTEPAGTTSAPASPPQSSAATVPSQETGVGTSAPTGAGSADFLRDDVDIDLGPHCTAAASALDVSDAKLGPWTLAHAEQSPDNAVTDLSECYISAENSAWGIYVGLRTIDGLSCTTSAECMDAGLAQVPGGRPIEIGAYPAALFADGSISNVEISLGNGRFMQVQIDGMTNLERAGELAVVVFTTMVGG